MRLLDSKRSHPQEMYFLKKTLQVAAWNLSTEPYIFPQPSMCVCIYVYIHYILEQEICKSEQEIVIKIQLLWNIVEKYLNLHITTLRYFFFHLIFSDLGWTQKLEASASEIKCNGRLLSFLP